MIRKILGATALLALFAFGSSQAENLEQLADQASPWYDLETPGRFLKSAQPRIPQIFSDSSHSFDVLHYQLNLNIPMQSGYYEGSMTMEFAVVDDSIHNVILDAVHLTADLVILDGGSAGFTQSDSALTVIFDEYYYSTDTLFLTVYFHDITTNRGYYYYPRNGYSFSEPEDARWWFPCFDEPWDKATSEMYITVPENNYVASNGYLESVYHNPNDQTRTYHWLNDYPIATYLMNFIIMNGYSAWEDYYVSPEDDSIPILNLVYTEDSTMAAYDFGNVPAMMQIYSQLFYPYPFTKYGQGAVTPFAYGAMEHQTMTTMNRNWIRGDRSMEISIAHELAHMWWGDMVTLADWRNIWLNEGFATYSSGIFAEQFYGHQRFMDELMNWRQIYIDHVNQYGHTPIYDPPYLFSVTVYFKGAWVLHMLRGLIGDTDFYSGMHNYAVQFGYGNANTRDFIDVMEAASGEDLDWFFNEWVFGQAHPIYRYSWSYSGSGPYHIDLNVRQVQTAAPPFTMPMTIRIFTGDDSLDFDIENHLEYQTYSFDVPTEPDSLALDPDNWILKESEEVTAIAEGEQPILPDHVKLLSPYPNPFNGTVNISFSIEGAPRKLTIDIYDIMGRKVHTLTEGVYESGLYAVTWNGRGDENAELSSGAYFILLKSDGISQTKKISYLR